ncbi:MAG: hypothetical protein V1725_07000 [archaeon]
MTWQLSSTKELLEVSRVGKNGRSAQHYLPLNEKTTDLRLIITSTDASLTIAPVTLERLMLHVDEKYPDKEIDLLVVNLKNGNTVESIGYYLTCGTVRMMEQYFFWNDLPGKYHVGLWEDREWPEERTALGGRLDAYFTQLKKERPHAAASLDACYAQLRSTK